MLVVAAMGCAAGGSAFAQAPKPQENPANNLRGTAPQVVKPQVTKPQTTQAAAPSGSSLPTVDSEPGSTTATFGDWVERCQKQAVGGETVRICEIAQSIQVQGQNSPVAEIAIGRLNKSDPLRLTILLPVNVSFPSTPRITVEGPEAGVVELVWKKCLPGGCIADTVLSPDQIKRWRSLTTAGKISSKDGLDREISIGMSFRGLSQALDALAKQL
ncbi:MAG: invasion associated locus B family protein [Alphaproteobacteria bacterium]|nr:invasion associated locus B family protein [Alphaproteobacteria bacterium]